MLDRGGVGDRIVGLGARSRDCESTERDTKRLPTFARAGKFRRLAEEAIADAVEEGEDSAPSSVLLVLVPVR